MTNEQNAPAYEATLRDLLACCLSWEPQVCVMGNVRAGDAAAALTVALSSPPAAGDADWVMVPREPTQAMRSAMYMAQHFDMRVQNPDEWGAVDKSYAAMLAAAPKPAAPPSVTDVAGNDPGEFGGGRWPDPQARYWMQRAAFWREQAIAHGYDPEALTHPGHKHAQEGSDA